MSIRNFLCQTMMVAGLVAFAATGATSATADSKVKHVFELFTSQGCYSCPPAEKLLGEIIDNNDEILGLEFHVDYWDTLVYGSAGKWQDPFSSPAYSQRQRTYNRLRLKGRTGVYTPQMIVNGQHAFVGSKKDKARKYIDRKSDLLLETVAELSDSGNLKISIEGDSRGKADVFVLVYDKVQVTEVESGENMGKTLTNFNVVRDFRSIGKWQGQSAQYETNVGVLEDNQNCAVIVQKYDSARQSVRGPVVGAAVC